MAVFNPQFKINQMAKDMGLKSKEMTDILTEKGQENVRSQRALTEQEFRPAPQQDRPHRVHGRASEPCTQP